MDDVKQVEDFSQLRAFACEYMPKKTRNATGIMFFQKLTSADHFTGPASIKESCGPFGPQLATLAGYGMT
jgi:hypothetical protein